MQGGRGPQRGRGLLGTRGLMCRARHTVRPTPRPIRISKCLMSYGNRRTAGPLGMRGLAGSSRGTGAGRVVRGAVVRGLVVEGPVVERLAVGIGPVGRLGRRVPDRLRRSCGRRVRGHPRRGSAARRTCAGWRCRAASGRRRTEWWASVPRAGVATGCGFTARGCVAAGRTVSAARWSVTRWRGSACRSPSTSGQRRAVRGWWGTRSRRARWSRRGRAVRRRWAAARGRTAGRRDSALRRPAGTRCPAAARRHVRRSDHGPVLRATGSVASSSAGGTFAGLAGDDPDDGQQPPPPRRRHLHRHHPSGEA